MKKSFQLFALLFSVSMLLNCGSKTKDETTTEATQTVEEIANETKATEDAATKRARIIKAKADKEEERKLAAIEIAKTNPSYTDASGRIIYNKAEVDPTFIGGEDAMNKYLNDNLVYPKEARDKGMEGTVFVDFVIDEKGMVTDVLATDVVGDDEVDETLKTEALRVVSAMPVWTPGRHKGSAVSTRFSVPITFQLESF